MRSARADLNGVSLWYAVTGEGPPVLLLHGGLANSNYWGNQVEVLRSHRTVIVVDSRGHGRSERDRRPFGYDLMADDVVALLSHLGLPNADVVGWSDGAIIGLDLAIRHPDRVRRLFAFAANTRTDTAVPTGGRIPAVFAAFIERAAREYAALSPTPGGFGDLAAQLRGMWRSQPNWTAPQLRTIRAPVLVVSGDRDEAIRLAHTRYMAATIPGADLCILRNAGHFALLQDPGPFNAAMLRFLA